MESELISIIGNLLDNAIEATQRAELPHEPVEVLIQLNARELIIEVADRGVGIRPDIRERILNAASPPKPVAITALVCILLNIMSLRRAAPSKSPITRREGTIFTLFIPADAHACPQPEAHDAS